MSGKTQVGVYREKRGDDSYTVYKSNDGEVVQVEHYDSKAAYSKIQSINFWAAEAPALIALIEKAAGIKKPRTEYEYGVEVTEHDGKIHDVREYGWYSDKESAQSILDAKLNRWKVYGAAYTARIVKRRKAGKVEDV